MPIKPVRAVSPAALILAMPACSSLRPRPGERDASALAGPAPPANRFAEPERSPPDLSAPAYADPALDPLRQATPLRFRGEQEFIGWLRAVCGAAKERGVYSWRDMPVAAMAPPAMAVPDSVQASDPVVVVTASSMPSDPTNPEITHNPKAGVDEGGIVKQIGNFLVGFQDGRRKRARRRARMAAPSSRRCPTPTGHSPSVCRMA